MSIKIRATKEEVGQRGKEAAEQIVKEFLGLEMRDATQEERDSVDQYFKKMAKAQGGQNMNLDEMIADYEKKEATRLYGNITMVPVSKVLTDLKKVSNVEYNRKVKIPKFVADWIKSAKYEGEWPGIFFDDECISPEIQQWNSSNKNCEIFMSAWTNGYEVNEEPMYEIVLFDNGTDRLLVMELNERDCEIDWECNNAGYRTQWFTKEQITKIDKRYLPFAEPVEEIDYLSKDISF